VRNFCVVDSGVLWRGESPSAKDAAWLVEHGVQSVFSIQIDARRSFEHAAVRPDVGRSVTYFHVEGADPFQILSRKRLDHLVALFIAIMDEAPKPLYVHCRAGVDRVGILIASYRILVGRISREEAVKEMAGYRSPWLPLERRYFLGLTPARQREILDEAKDWKARLKPLGRFECERGRCSFAANPDAAVARP
jgi:protein-tyrosine phosphatase